MYKHTVPAACWDCPVLETPETRERDSLRRIPSFQNLEADIYRFRMAEESILSGDLGPEDRRSYPVKDLSSLRDFDFNLLEDDRIRQVLALISDKRNHPLLLEAECPFSVLAGLMNPVDLYMCFMEEEELLTEILVRIGDASADYLAASVDAGCRYISLADPAGTMNLTGEENFRRFCGMAEIRLMQKCRPFLDQAVIHLCRRTSLSLVMAGMAEAKEYPLPEELTDKTEILAFMAEDPGIHYAGMTCIHDDSGFRYPMKICII